MHINRPVRTEAQKLIELAIEAATPSVDACRSLARLRDEASNENFTTLAKTFEEKRCHYRNAAIDVLAAPILAYAIPILWEIEDVHIPRLAPKDKEYITLCAALKIVDYWSTRPKPVGGYILKASFMRSIVRDVIRESWNFGRKSRKRIEVPLHEVE